MPTFNVTISNAALTKLKAIVDRYNADNGTALTVLEWISLHIRELAIQDNLLAAAQTFQRQAEQSTADAIAAERTRLLDSVA